MMKICVIALVLALSAGISGLSYADYDYNNEEIRTYDGRVTSADIANSALTVDGAGDENITFPITTETKFTRDIYDTKMSDIKAGDYVTVSYYRYPSESRKPIRTIHVDVHYGNEGAGD